MDPSSALCFGSSMSAGAIAAAGCSGFEQLLGSVRLSGGQRQALQQLLDAAAASHAANHVSRQQQLALLATQLRWNVKGSTSDVAGIVGSVGWETVQLLEAVHSSCNSDAAVLQQVLQQCWGAQSPLSLVQRVRCLAAAQPHLPGYCLLEALLGCNTAT